MMQVVTTLPAEDTDTSPARNEPPGGLIRNSPWDGKEEGQCEEVS
jgi:hypothetical protein